MQKKQADKLKVTIVMNREEKSALEKRAKAERLSLSALVRRFAVGLAALALVACGSDFSSQKTAGGIGGGAGIGTSGTAGMPADNGGSPDAPAVGEGHLCNDKVACDAGLFCDGDGKCSLQSELGGACSTAAECVSGHCVDEQCAAPVAPYDGPPWVDCSGSAIVARGFSALWSEVSFSVTAASHGPDWSLMTLVPTINGELPPLISTNKSRSMDSANQTLTFTLSSPLDPSFAPSDLIEVGIGWSPREAGNIVDVSPSACSALVNGEKLAAWP